MLLEQYLCFLYQEVPTDSVGGESLVRAGSVPMFELLAIYEHTLSEI